jgi:regulator of replication initiation timing
MGERFAQAASRYYQHATQTDGRRLSWAQAQGEVSHLYRLYKDSYEGDLDRARPCHPLFESKVGDHCVRTVGKSQMHLPYAWDVQMNKLHSIRAAFERTRQTSARATRILAARYSATRKRMMSQISRLQAQLHTTQQEALLSEQHAWKVRDERLQNALAQLDATALQHQIDLQREQDLVKQLELAQLALLKPHDNTEELSKALTERDTLRSNLNQIDAKHQAYLQHHEHEQASLQQKLSDALEHVSQVISERDRTQKAMDELVNQMKGIEASKRHAVMLARQLEVTLHARTTDSAKHAEQLRKDIESKDQERARLERQLKESMGATELERVLIGECHRKISVLHDDVRTLKTTIADLTARADKSKVQAEVTVKSNSLLELERQRLQQRVLDLVKAKKKIISTAAPRPVVQHSNVPRPKFTRLEPPSTDARLLRIASSTPLPNDDSGGFF